MTIHFSPYYTSHCYTGLEQRKGKVAFNETTVNQMGLLALLELRLGLSQPDTPQVKRLPEYFKAMRQVMNTQQGNILSDSWEADALGTAKKCLEWRDTLVMAGWVAGTGQPSERLALLAEVERIFKDRSAAADRWQRVIKALGEPSKLDAQELTVKVGLQSEDALQPLMRHVLKLLNEKGASVEYAQPGALAGASTNLGRFQQALLNHHQGNFTLKDDKTLRVLSFPTDTEAARYLVAMHSMAQPSLYIARDCMSMNYAQRMVGEPTSGCSISCSMEHEMQLLPLAVEQWANPYNVRSLMQWLQIAVHPIHPKLRSMLTRVLSTEGGRDNEKWDDAIGLFLKEVDDETKEKVSARLQWALPRNKQKEVDKQDFTHFITELKKWADARRHFEARKDAMLAHQLASLSEALGVMLLLIDSVEGDVLNFEQLQQWASTLYNGGEHDMTVSQVGSMNIVSHPGDIRSVVKQLTWTDCYNAVPGKDDCDFLNAKEREELEHRGCKLTSPMVLLEAEQQAQTAALLQASEQVTLVMADENVEGATSMHPILIKLKQLMGNEAWASLVQKPVIDEDLLQQLPAIHNEQKLQPKIEITKGELIKMADHESYSALTNLVNHPVDYLLGRILKLDTMQEESIGEKETTMGTVAHRVIELLFNGSADKIGKAISQSYDETFEQAVGEKGALLLLPENKLEKLRMKMVLRQSVDTLLSIIRENQLKVIDTEMDIDGDFDLGNGEMLPVTGQADMVLERQDGKWVVFDFKWSTSKSWYENLLKNDTSLQLAIYKEMLSKKADVQGHTHEVVATAYYQLPLCKMHTQSGELRGKQVNHVTPCEQNNLIAQLRNSYLYRREQFADGQIDNGDLLALEKTAYGSDQEEKDMLRLDTDFSDKANKSANKFTHFPLFKTPLR